MGTVLDLFMSKSHDFVDNSYWSAMQIKVKRMTMKDEEPIGLID